MAYDLWTFPDGFAEKMTRQDMAVSYSTLPEEVHNLVGLILGTSGDRFQAVHSVIDTPALALRALQLNVGRQLPTYGHIAFPDLTEVGETRTIEEEDMFAIAEEPTIFRTRPYQHFLTVLERVPTDEPAPAQAPEPTRFQNLFYMLANAR